MRFADCVPIMLYDPIRGVVGLVHAGWQGTVKKIAEKAVEKMQSHFGSKPGDILAGIGPSIGPDHYEIQRDVKERFRNAFGDAVNPMIIERDNRIWLNLWEANKHILIRCRNKKNRNRRRMHRLQCVQMVLS